jgi:hypothetical protein
MRVLPQPVLSGSEGNRRVLLRTQSRLPNGEIQPFDVGSIQFDNITVWEFAKVAQTSRAV